MKTLNIKARYETLSEAVNQAGIDLSYNKQSALQDIKQTEPDVEQAFITEDGEVYYIFKCDIRVLNKYEPFTHCLDDSPFQLIEIGDHAINFHDSYYEKTMLNRKIIARAKCVVA